MIHAILIVLGIWWAWNWLTRKRPPSMKLVQRTPEQRTQIVAWHKQQHDTFAQRHTVDFNRTSTPS
jgi:ABC-type nickel/cobalt efflux system permease component RcnA